MSHQEHIEDLLEKQNRELQDLGESPARGHGGRGSGGGGKSLRVPWTQKKSQVIWLCLSTGCMYALDFTVVFTPVHLLIR